MPCCYSSSCKCLAWHGGAQQRQRQRPGQLPLGRRAPSSHTLLILGLGSQLHVAVYRQWEWGCRHTIRKGHGREQAECFWIASPPQHAHAAAALGPIASARGTAPPRAHIARAAQQRHIITALPQRWPRCLEHPSGALHLWLRDSYSGKPAASACTTPTASASTASTASASTAHAMSSSRSLK